MDVPGISEPDDAASSPLRRPVGGPEFPTQRRPRTAITASLLLVGLGLIGLIGTWALLSLVNDDASHGQSVDSIVYLLFYAQLVLSAAQVASGVFLWQGRAWARTLAIVICTVNIIAGLISLFTGALFQACIGVVVNIVLVRLLANDEVKDWCRS